jgi:hypothetical protein
MTATAIRIRQSDLQARAGPCSTHTLPAGEPYLHAKSTRARPCASSTWKATRPWT